MSGTGLYSMRFWNSILSWGHVATSWSILGYLFSFHRKNQLSVPPPNVRWLLQLSGVNPKGPFLTHSSYSKTPHNVYSLLPLDFGLVTFLTIQTQRVPVPCLPFQSASVPWKLAGRKSWRGRKAACVEHLATPSHVHRHQEVGLHLAEESGHVGKSKSPDQDHTATQQQDWCACSFFKTYLTNYLSVYTHTRCMCVWTRTCCSLEVGG